MATERRGRRSVQSIHAAIARRLQTPTGSAAWRYGLALLINATALGIQMIVGAGLSPGVFLPAYGAAILSGYLCGFGPAVAGVVFSSIATSQLLMAPMSFTDPQGWRDLQRVLLFSAVAPVWGWIVSSLRVHQWRVRQQLQSYVDERTAERDATLMRLAQQLEVTARAEEQAQLSARRAQALADFSRQLAEVTPSEASVAAVLCRHAVEVIGDVTALRLLNEAGDWTVPLVYHPDPAIRRQLQAVLDAGDVIRPEIRAAVVRDGRTLRVPVVTPELLQSTFAAPARTQLAQSPIHSLLVVPVRAQGRVLGIVVLGREQPDRAYSDNDQALAEALAYRGALGILNARLIDRLQHEVNERRRAEAALRESEHRFQQAFEHAPVGMALVGLDGQVVQINAALPEMLGYEREELLRLPVMAVMHPDDRGAAEADRRRLVGGECDSYRAERRYVHRSGRVVWTEMAVSLVRSDVGEPLYVVSQMQDITERMHAVLRQRQAHEELERRVAERTAELAAANEALQRERDFAELVLQSSVDGILTFDRKIRYTSWNGAMERMTDLSREQVIGRDAFDLFPFLLDARMDKDFAAVLRGETVMRTDVAHVIPATGRDGFSDAHMVPLRARSGAIIGGLVVVRDVTERHKADEQLRQAESKYRTLVEHLPATTYLLEMRDWPPRVLYMSPQVGSMLGFSPDDFLSTPGLWERLLHADDRAQMLDVATAITDAGHFSVEYRLRTKTGDVRWVRDDGVLVRDGANDGPYVQGVLLDITARKTAEIELEQLTQRMTDLLESMRDGFVAFDAEARFTYVNRTAETMMRRPRGDLLGQCLWVAFPEFTRTPFRDQFQRVLATGATIAAEAYYAPVNRWYRVHAYPARDGVAAVFEDLTERHQAEASILSDILRALNRALDVPAAFPAVVEGVRALTDCDRVSLSVFDDDGGADWATLAAQAGTFTGMEIGARMPIHELPGFGRVVAGEPLIIENLEPLRQFAAVVMAEQHGLHSFMILPVSVGGRLKGILTLLWSREGAASATPLPLLSQVADAVALALEKGRLFAQVRSSHERLEALSRRIMEVQEEERRRIARELHDEIGQHLTGLKFALDLVDRRDSTGTALRDAHRIVDDLVSKVRELSLELRPLMLDDLGLLPALVWLLDRYTAQTRIEVVFQHHAVEHRRFDPDIETAVYRIVQEALTNAARYARVKQVTLRVYADLDTLRVQVIDRGAGFDPVAALRTGTTGGLAGMQERARLLSGHVTIESGRAAGTCVDAAIPLRPTSNGRGHYDFDSAG